MELVSDDGFDEELGFRPCRREHCSIECHPEHDEDECEWDLKAHLKRIREIAPRSYTHVNRRKREAFEQEMLERLGITPVRVLETDTGQILRLEWRCPVCQGKGWTSLPDTGCTECYGHGIVLKTRTDFVTRLIQLRRLKSRLANSAE